MSQVIFSKTQSSRVLFLFAIWTSILAQTSVCQPINRLALLIGIGEYQKNTAWPRLHTDLDALKLKGTLLAQQFPEQNISILLNSEAQYSNIQLALKQLVDKAEPEDQVVIYLGGHCQKITDLSGDEADNWDEAFVTFEAGHKYKRDTETGRNHFLDDELSRWINRIAEKITRNGNLLIIYDGGISRTGISKVPVKGPFSPFEIKKDTIGRMARPIIEFDNDWLDLSYTENNTQITTVTPENSANCNFSEILQGGKNYSGPLMASLQKGLSKPGIRYRDLSKILKSDQEKWGLNCGWIFEGTLSSEIFKKGKLLINPALNSGPSNEAKGKTFSVIIGVSKYQNIPPLEYGHSDALLFRSLLQASFLNELSPENQYLFIDSNATIKPIIMAFEAINQKIAEGDRVYFYFAGHGDVENLLNRKGHLLLYNSPSNVYKAGGTLPVEDVKDYFAQWLYKRARVFLVVDACKSGKLAGGLEGKEVLLSTIGDGINQSARLLSCQPNEFSQESVDFGGGHGAFTYYLAKGIQGKADQNKDAKISIGEIGEFIHDSVSNSTLKQQNPVVQGNSNLPFLPVITSQLTANQTLPALNYAPDLSGRSTDDSLKVRWKKEFYRFLKISQFISPPGNCAKSSFEQLTNTFPLDEKLKGEITVAFQDAIDKKSQNLINEYIKGNDQLVQEEVFASAAKELNYLLDTLMSSTDQLYFSYLARKFFFEGRSIKPQQVENDLHRHTLNSAILNLKSSLKIEPEGAQNYNAIGRLRQSNLQFEQAILNYKKAMELAPNWKFPINNLATAFDDLASQKRDKKLLDSAIFYYKKCLKIDPKFAGAHKNLGKAYWNAGLSIQAKQQYLKGIFYNPSYVETYQNLGDAYRIEQKYDSATYYLRIGLSIKPDHPNILTNLGNVAFEMAGAQQNEKNDYLKEARDYYLKAVKVDSLCVESLVGLGHVYWESAKYDSSSFFYEKSVRLDSANLLFQNYLMQAYLRTGNLPKADLMGQKLTNRYPNDATTWFDFGVLAVLQKNEMVALNRFKKAISLGQTQKASFESEPLLENFRKGKSYAQLLKTLK